MRGIGCLAGFFLPVVLFAAETVPWWQELAQIGLDNRKGNEEVLVVCDTPEKLAELFIERTQLDIWNKHHTFNLGANWPERLARKYLDHCPADIKPKAQVLFKSPVTKETASGIREWFYLDQARKRAELARKTVEFVRTNKGKVTADQLAELTAVETAVQNALSVTNVPTGGDLFRRAYAVRRAILFTHPKLQFEKLLVNKNPPTTYPHNCDQYLGRHSRIGPGLTVLTDWQSGSPKQKVLCEGTLPPGAYSKPALSYDGKKIAFAYADHTPTTNALWRFFLYEVGVNGKGLRQLTGTARDTFETWYDRQTVMIEDCDPHYLPDGGLAFVSTRAQCFGRCHGPRYTPSLLLYRCDEDGDDIRQLSFGSENETTPSVLPDGRILFTRWEYIDRHEMEFHKLWWKRPDGTMISHYYGNDTIYPLMISEALPVPGTTKVMATGTGHHNFHAGTVMLIDTTKGENGTDPVTRMTPEVKYPESDECGHGTGGAFLHAVSARRASVLRVLFADERMGTGQRAAGQTVGHLSVRRSGWTRACFRGSAERLFLADSHRGARKTAGVVVDPAQKTERRGCAERCLHDPGCESHAQRSREDSQARADQASALQRNPAEADRRGTSAFRSRPQRRAEAASGYGAGRAGRFGRGAGSFRRAASDPGAGRELHGGDDGTELPLPASGSKLHMRTRICEWGE
jgi:hypothetical protein